MFPALRWFRYAAVAEACSWAGLLTGMFFKYVVVRNEIGVQVFGPIHGAMFVAYVVSVLVVWRVERWSLARTALGLFSAVPPFMTIWFERWVLRRTPDGPEHGASDAARHDPRHDPRDDVNEGAAAAADRRAAAG